MTTMSILRCPHRARRQSITGRETIPRRSWLPEPMRRRSPFERPRWPNRLSSSEHWRALLPTPKDYRRVARCRARRGGCLPNKLDVSLRDLPGERVVRNAKVERVEPPPLSAIRRHIVMCIFNQPHHGPRIASAPKPTQFRRSSCCRYFVRRHACRPMPSGVSRATAN